MSSLFVVLGLVSIGCDEQTITVDPPEGDGGVTVVDTGDASLPALPKCPSELVVYERTFNPSDDEDVFDFVGAELTVSLTELDGSVNPPTAAVFFSLQEDGLPQPLPHEWALGGEQGSARSFGTCVKMNGVYRYLVFHGELTVVTTEKATVKVTVCEDPSQAGDCE